MNLTAREMTQLEDDARAIASDTCRGYLSHAMQCLRETRDPIAPLELLRAMWSGGHGARPNQKAALNDAGLWLDTRLEREPGISPDRLALELGWLRRLVVVHAQRGPATDDRPGSPPPREPAFGARVEQLRRKRERELARGQEALAPRPAAGQAVDAPRRPIPEQLPAVVEMCFDSWDDALKAFKTARKRRKESKPPKDRLLAVRPIVSELRALGNDIACSLLTTDGMDELEARTTANAGKPPPFWIVAADLVERDGKRVPPRISFDANRAAR